VTTFGLHHGAGAAASRLVVTMRACAPHTHCRLQTAPSVSRGKVTLTLEWAHQATFEERLLCQGPETYELMRWINDPLSSPTNGSTRGPDWPQAGIPRVTIASCWLRQHAASHVNVGVACTPSASHLAMLPRLGHGPLLSRPRTSPSCVRCSTRPAPSCLSACCPLSSHS
jgi:hypothetical protein